MLNFRDFIPVYVFTTNHHLKSLISKRNGGEGGCQCNLSK